MVKEFWTSHRTAILIVASVIIVLLLVIGGIGLLNRPPEKVNTEPILKITYCDADPEELCILSFGRDLEDQLIVNFFVPDRNFPDFYLKIKRAVGESIYECERNKEVPTSVYCTGESIALEERIEIDLISKENDRLLATGRLVLTAILLSTQGAVTGAGEIIPATPTTGNATATATTASPTASYP